MQGRLTGLFHLAQLNFVLDADHPRHSARVRLGAGPLVRPFDNALQSNPAVVHFRGHKRLTGTYVEFPLQSITVGNLKALCFLQAGKKLLRPDNVETKAAHFEDVHLLTNDVPARFSDARFGSC